MQFRRQIIIEPSTSAMAGFKQNRISVVKKLKNHSLIQGLDGMSAKCLIPLITCLVLVGQQCFVVGFSVQSFHHGVRENVLSTTSCFPSRSDIRASRNEPETDGITTRETNQEQDTLVSLSKRLQMMLQPQPNQDDSPTPTPGHIETTLIKQRKQQQILSTRLRNLNLNLTYVAPSTVAGRGLFARQSVKRGTLLTCYPGDALVLLSEDKTVWGDHIDDYCSKSFSIDQEFMLRAITDEWGIVALPELDKDPAYLGHFANDGVEFPPRCEADLSLYVLDSNDIANAMHQGLEGCHMVTIATRDIERDEEIFVTYGPEYWMEQDSFGLAGHDDRTYYGGPSTGMGFG